MPTLKLVGEPSVVDAQTMQNGRLDIVHFSRSQRNSRLAASYNKNR